MTNETKARLEREASVESRRRWEELDSFISIDLLERKLERAREGLNAISVSSGYYPSVDENVMLARKTLADIDAMEEK